MTKAGKPISKSDLEKIALFRAELIILAKLKAQGMAHKEALKIVWSEYMQDNDGNEGNK